MAGIRVKSGTLKVEVNDNGDYIVLRKDMQFINNLQNLQKGLVALQTDYAKKLAVLDKSDIQAKTDLVYNASLELHDAIDLVFGKGTCKKVFGEGITDVLPTADLVADFFNQLKPYFKQIIDELNSSKKKLEAEQETANITQFTPKGYMGGAPKPASELTSHFDALRQKLDGGDSDEV